MSTANFLRSRKARILGAVLIALLWYVFQQIGPNPAIRIARDTTYITAPLTKDGLPDYLEALRQEQRKGVTPENNAAALIFRTTPWKPNEDRWLNWPESVREQIAAEMGVDVPRDEALLFEPSYDDGLKKKTEDWLTEIDWRPSAKDDPFDRIEGDTDEEFARDLKSFLESRRYCQAYFMVGWPSVRPWRSENYPPMAAWLHRSERALDLAVEASHRDKYYSPPFPDPESDGPPLMGARWTMDGQVGQLSDGLCIRAMWHAGEGRLNQAYDELQSVRRLARLVGQTPRMSSQRTAFDCEMRAMWALRTLVAADLGDAAFYARVRQDLANSTPPCDMARAITLGDRFESLDAVIDLMGNLDRYNNGKYNSLHVKYISKSARIDWNLILSEVNSAFNTMQEGLSESDPQQRAALKQHFYELYYKSHELNDRPAPSPWSFISMRGRSEAIFTRLGESISPSYEAVGKPQRLAASTQLVLVAAALAEWRSVHGDYPKQLDELVPELLAAAPIDAFGEAIGYDRRDNGYLLYCRDPSAKAHMPRSTLSSEFYTEAEAEGLHIRDSYGEIGAFYSVRVPREQIEWPAP